MNFNISEKPEYKLHTSLIKELIDLYGIRIKFLITEKINLDKECFGDFSHIKTNKNSIFDFYVLPVENNNFDILDYNFTDYGYQSVENTSLLVSGDELQQIIDLKKVIGNLIVLPSNKVMEITDINLYTEGVNNLYTFSDPKSVYTLTCVPYEFKINDEITHDHLINQLLPENDQNIIGEVETSLYKTNKIIAAPTDEDLLSTDKENYDALDNYFKTLIDRTKEQDYEAEQNKYTTQINDNLNTEITELDKQAVYIKKETDIFNGL